MITLTCAVDFSDERLELAVTSNGWVREPVLLVVNPDPVSRWMALGNYNSK